VDITDDIIGKARRLALIAFSALRRIGRRLPSSPRLASSG
jgi:hypothetical protein